MHSAAPGHVIWGGIDESSSSQFSSDHQVKPPGSILDGVTQLHDTSSSDPSRESGANYLSPNKLDRESCEGPRAENFEELSKLSREQLIPLLPLDDNGMPTSIGTRGHAGGWCSPCSFVQRNKVCNQGLYCGFCHLPHAPGEKKRSRPCKGQRIRYRKVLERLKADIECGIEPTTDELPPSIAQSEEKKSRLMAKLLHHRMTVQALSAVDAYKRDSCSNGQVRNLLSL